MSNKSKSDSTTAHLGRGRGRGSSRGGFGKYLRARGRRGAGRPAQFHERLLLEGEKLEDEDEETVAELRAKYGPRQLGSNADRFAESEPELDSDGEPIAEPEVDLSKFLERQRLSDEQGLSFLSERAANEDDVDHSLAHITSGPAQKRLPTSQKKGKMEELVWNEELESMAREKAAAEAKWDLKERFKSKSEIFNAKRIPTTKGHKAGNAVTEAPPLPLSAPPKDPKAQMQDFLDQLLD